MPLEPAIADITTRLRQGKFPNESSISQGIVLRILQELGWTTWDPALVWPEYQTGEGRADFALCHPPGKPAIFIEVKQPGKAEESVRQALEYAFHVGVPLVTLTDGRTWSFYLPAEQGSYEDRRVYKLDLFERPPAESAATLTRYLDCARVQAGQVLETARTEYRSRNRRSQAQSAIPEVWRELVEKGDETLVDLVASAVESKTGVRPEADDVADFLVRLSQISAVGKIRMNSEPAAPGPKAAPEVLGHNNHKPSRSGTLRLLGKPYRYTNAKDAMVIADEIGANAALETDDLDHGTLKSRGGLPRALALFGRERLPVLLEELNTALAA